MNEEDTNLFLSNQTKIRDTLKYHQKHIRKLHQQIDALSEALEYAVREDNPKIQAIAKRLADEETAKEKLKWAEEKEQIIKDAKVSFLKAAQIKDIFDKFNEHFKSTTENNSTIGDIYLQRKMRKPEEQTEKLTFMHHQEVSGNSEL